jgi:hypothetical protein
MKDYDDIKSVILHLLTHDPHPYMTMQELKKSINRYLDCEVSRFVVTEAVLELIDDQLIYRTKNWNLAIK